MSTNDIGDGIDWDAVRDHCSHIGLDVGEVTAATYALYRMDEMRRGISGQTVRTISLRHVAAAMTALGAAAEFRGDR